MISTESLYTRTEKKNNGIFYTPRFLSDYLALKALEFVQKDGELNILDPACGDSVLLNSFCELLKIRDSHIHKIVGVDIDNNSIFRSSSVLKSTFSNFNFSFIQTDSLKPFNNESCKSGWVELRNKVDSPKFDVVLSNPPWGSDLSQYSRSYLSSNFVVAKGQFDTYNLFVELILENLKNGGVYGLILPDSVFSQEHSRLRALLALETSICLISRLGEKIFPDINRACVVIIGRKMRPESNQTVDCFRLDAKNKKDILSNRNSLLKLEKSLNHQVLQSRFQDNEGFLFDIDLKSNELSTINRITSKRKFLGDYTTSTRGAEISKRGEVLQCPNCNKWMPSPKINFQKCNSCGIEFNNESALRERIVLNHNGLGNLPLKVGEDLFRFTSRTKSWLNTTKEGINYKDLSIYRGKKILVRKTGVGVTASLDYDDSITNQVVYILKLKPEWENTITLEFVLAVLNSRVITYFLIKRYGENEWKSHPYLTQSMLAKLPFPDIDLNSAHITETIKKITKIVYNEVSINSGQNISKESDIYIEYLIAKLFGLSKNDYAIIFEALRACQQLKPISRLLNCQPKEIFKKHGL